MKVSRSWIIPLVCCAVCLSPVRSHATDVDGPNDCIQARIDEGDAPEGIPAYATGVVGHFPTCVGLYFLPGTMEVDCPPISLPPGPTGYMEHFQFPDLPPFWLGCYPAAAPIGFDNETDGKVSVGLPPGSLPPPISACGSLPIDCVETAADGMKFGQDECYLDGSDAGVTSFQVFPTCSFASVPFMVSSCPDPTQNQRVIFLNILVDFNQDGDWNDNFACVLGAPCAYEWAVKNVPLTIIAGCNSFGSPAFPTGKKPGPGWMRISVTKEPVPDDYPWAGAAGMGGGAYEGGETEDYPILMEGQVPVIPETWGGIKSRHI